jgi:hypothetical protein
MGRKRTHEELKAKLDKSESTLAAREVLPAFLLLACLGDVALSHAQIIYH